MTRIVPAPLLSAALVGGWLLLNQSVSAGHIVLGAVLAILLPLAMRELLPAPARWRRPAVAARLALIVLWDIVVSNFDVARRILGPESAIRAGYVWVRLDISDARAIATLASIITWTPGTVSVDLSADRRHLLIHALQADDPAGLIATIKARYEAPLREIFE